MEFFNSALGKNITFVRPAYFIITGFIGIPHIKYYYVFLFFVYFVSVLANGSVLAVICLDPSLRTPKHVAVFNLAFVDLLGSSALVPELLHIFLFNNHHIAYGECLVFLFFCYACLSMQALNLVALCCDRLVAIVSPLHYQVRVTHRFMFSLIGSFWLFVVVAVLITVGLLTRLSFCRSVVINSYFCDHGQIYKLACNDTTPSAVLSRLLPLVILWLPLSFVLLTYLCIGFALTKVSTTRGRAKAFKTCTAHLSLVAIYFVPMLVTFSSNLAPNTRIVNLSLSNVFPPMLNPIIYVLQTQEIKQSVKSLLRIRTPSDIRAKQVVTR